MSTAVEESSSLWWRQFSHLTRQLMQLKLEHPSKSSQKNWFQNSNVWKIITVLGLFQDGRSFTQYLKTDVKMASAFLLLSRKRYARSLEFPEVVKIIYIFQKYT